ncbi:MAG: glycosyltransferase family 9 protein [Verrucomicrobiota bacterium]
MPKQARILVLRGGAIGDFILTVPAIQALRDRWPDAYIELVGYPHIANLALAGGLVDHVESLDRAEIARFFALRYALDERQEEYIRSFDLVISYLHDPDGSVRTNLLGAGAKQVVYGSPIVTQGHAIDHLMKPLEALAIYGERPDPRLNLRGTQREEETKWLAQQGLAVRPVALHPGSGSPKKNWPLEGFIELARRIRGSGAGAPFFVIGEADADLAIMLAELAADVPIVQNHTLVELASVLAGCVAYVGNDSGITHLAAALGIPVVALFGQGEPDRWGPRGPNVCILNAPDGDLAKLGVDQAWDAVERLLSS